MKRIPDDPPSGVRLRDDAAFIRATQAAAVGLEIGGRRAQTRDMSERMTRLACDIRALAEGLGTSVRRPSTSERLRWEWLASTSTVLDGGPERRIADEAVRTLEAALEDADEDLAPKLRRAVAQCRALVA
jgi:hypothetical protein